MLTEFFRMHITQKRENKSTVERNLIECNQRALYRLNYSIDLSINVLSKLKSKRRKARESKEETKTLFLLFDHAALHSNLERVLVSNVTLIRRIMYILGMLNL